ncbi:MAG: PilZ domain-containing protein [Deltaproteobacteria bacterium]|nr:PilZ domain-containing protein [Deltaproteobacteria bacterium]
MADQPVQRKYVQTAKEAADDGKRRILARHSINLRPIEVSVNGETLPVHITDLSEEGMRIQFPSGTVIKPSDELAIRIESVPPHIVGRIRWLRLPPAQSEQMLAGVQFETLGLQSVDTARARELALEWGAKAEVKAKTTHLPDQYLEVLENLDTSMLDGLVQDLSEAVAGAVTWLNGPLGAFNGWYRAEVDKTFGPRPFLELTPLKPPMEARRALAARALIHGEARAEGLVTMAFDGLIFEFAHADDDLAAARHQALHVLARRIPLWTRILMKNISLQILGEEVALYRQSTLNG